MRLSAVTPLLSYILLAEMSFSKSIPPFGEVCPGKKKIIPGTDAKPLWIFLLLDTYGIITAGRLLYRLFNDYTTSGGKNGCRVLAFSVPLWYNNRKTVIVPVI